LLRTSQWHCCFRSYKPTIVLPAFTRSLSADGKKKCCVQSLIH
jgi:hypothetical protein